MYILPDSAAWAAEGEADIHRLSRSCVEFAGLGLSPDVTASVQPIEISDMYYDFGVMAYEVWKDSFEGYFHCLLTQDRF